MKIMKFGFRSSVWADAWSLLYGLVARNPNPGSKMGYGGPERISIRFPTNPNGTSQNRPELTRRRVNCDAIGWRIHDPSRQHARPAAHPGRGAQRVDGLVPGS